jgi:hypothetical protein
MTTRCTCHDFGRDAPNRLMGRMKRWPLMTMWQLLEKIEPHLIGIDGTL